jgi:ribosome-binding factor A
MSTKRPSRKSIRLLCGEVAPDDGTDPRFDPPKNGPPRRAGRKRLQLCRQVEESLREAFACQKDDILRELDVIAVGPGSDRTRLCVTLRLDPAAAHCGPQEVLDRLQHASGRLRCEVAGAITRRRTPEIEWRLALAGPE